ncbi:Condensin complex subunit 1 [Orchesella cincta]|uniref:Condensin complex subunit 1 n=1 Tax=Orchesella cincta TaxID=48709 RepID=A0A1D2M9W0_ORCCI|nr:Condensin complex subunit 1 [Orchesella cincta]
MEKMNDCISTGLADKDPRIRKACMDYIQYLALSDLLKVREQLSDTVACLCDESQELREMAKDFINEISEKDNILQNSIPDIISRLSTREDITQEDFRGIMKTLLTKIKKEKQLGGLVERIVGRFKGPISIRVAQDTAFCLTQVQQNDKTLKILKDNAAAYADKLGDEGVWDHFLEVLAAIRKLNKPDLKTKIDEWEKELEEHRSKCVALLEAENAAKKKTDKPHVAESESSEDEEEAEQGGEQDNMETEQNDQEGGEQENGDNEGAESEQEQEGDVTEKFQTDEEDEQEATNMEHNDGSDGEQMDVESAESE